MNKTRFLKIFAVNLLRNRNPAIFFGVFICLLLLIVDYSANAASTANASGSSKTTITSDIIDINRKTKSIEFLKNVVIKSQDSIMRSDKMKVIYVDEVANEDQSKIKKIEAFGSVKIEMKEGVATSKYGYYDPSQKFFVLEHDVVVSEGGSIAKGEKFIYNTITQKGNFVGKTFSNLGKSSPSAIPTEKSSAKVKEGDGRVTIIIQDDLLEKRDKSKKN